MERASKREDNFQGQMAVFYHLEISHHLDNTKYQRGQIHLLISSSFTQKLVWLMGCTQIVFQVVISEVKVKKNLKPCL